MADTQSINRGVREGSFDAAPQYKRRSDEEIKKLARASLSGELFGSWMVEDPFVTTKQCFLFLSLIDDIAAKVLQRDNIVHFYQFFDPTDARQTFVNGHPVFLSGYMLDQTDYIRLLEQAMKAKMK